MRNLLVTLALLVPFWMSAQQKSDYRIVLKKETGVFTLSLGTVINASTWHIHSGEKLEKVHIAGMVFSYSIGVGLWIYSFERQQKKSKPKFL